MTSSGSLTRAGRQGEALLLAAGQLADPVPGLVFQVHPRQQFPGRQTPGVEAAQQGKNFAEGQVFVVRGSLQLNAGAGLDFAPLAGGVQPQHADFAGVGMLQALDDFQRGGLARPVGPQQPENLALLNAEGKTINGDNVAVPLH